MSSLVYFVIYVIIWLADGICQPGWKEHRDKCYGISTETMHWPACQTYCSDRSAHMLCVRDSDQNEFIQNVSPTNAWLGYNDRNEEGTWVWQTGCSSNFTKWFPNEPNNYNDDQDCGRLIKNGGSWDDCGCTSCTGKQRCMCEKGTVQSLIIFT